MERIIGHLGLARFFFFTTRFARFSFFFVNFLQGRCGLGEIGITISTHLWVVVCNRLSVKAHPDITSNQKK